MVRYRYSTCRGLQTKRVSILYVGDGRAQSPQYAVVKMPFTSVTENPDLRFDLLPTAIEGFRPCIGHIHKPVGRA